MTSPREIRKTTIIQSAPSKVWAALTDPTLMKRWMAEPEMELEVETDWMVGGRIRIKGFHHTKFINNGTVLAFDPNSLLRYSHLSSISRLPDKPSSYSIIEFRLIAKGSQTEVTVILSNFPTVSILKHLDFYWTGTMSILKDYVEKITSKGGD